MTESVIYQCLSLRLLVSIKTDLTAFQWVEFENELIKASSLSRKCTIESLDLCYLKYTLSFVCFFVINSKIYVRR